MAKVAAEAAGRQAASFVLGCVAALTLVLILQRRPDELTRPRAPVQFFGSTRSSSSPSGRGGTSSSGSPSTAIVAADGQLQAPAPVQANATKLKPAAGATASADDLRRVPGSPAHRQQEVGWLVGSSTSCCCCSVAVAHRDMHASCSSIFLFFLYQINLLDPRVYRR